MEKPWIRVQDPRGHSLSKAQPSLKPDSALHGDFPACVPPVCVPGRRSSEVTASSFSPVVAAAGLVLRRQKILKAGETVCFSHYLLNLRRQFVGGAEPTCLSSPNMSPPSLHHAAGGLRMNTKHTFVPTACHCAPPGDGS